MIPASRFGGLNDVTMANLNAASAHRHVRFQPKRKTFARSENYRIDPMQNSATAPNATCVLSKGWNRVLVNYARHLLHCTEISE
jgi:hypothetical protein